MRVEPSRQRYDPLGWQKGEHMEWRKKGEVRKVEECDRN